MQGRNELGLQAFFDAIESGDLNAVLNLAESVDVNACQKKCVNSRTIDKSTVELSPLMLACRLGRLNVVKILLNLPQLKCDLQSNNGYTALHYAVFEGHLPIVKMLIAKGASVNVCDKIGRSPLLTAVTYRKEVTNALVDCLLDAGADTSLKDSNGTSAFECSRLLGDSRNAQLIEDTSTFKEMTPKMFGEFRMPDKIQSAERYIAKFPKSTHVDKSFYDNALHAAVLADNGGMITLLVAAGADVDLVVNKEPLIYIAAKKNKEISVAALILKRALIDQSTLSHSDTALMAAVSNGNTAIVERLLNAGADVKLKAKSGATVIHCMRRKCPVSIAEALVRRGVDINSVYDANNYNALRYAISHGNVAMAHYLLSMGAKPNFVGKTSSCLNWSIKCDDDTLIMRLIEKEAEVNCVLENRTALSEAVRLNKVSAVNILLDAGADIDLGAGRDALLKSATSEEMTKILQEAITLKTMTYEVLGKLKSPEELVTAKKYILRHPNNSPAQAELYNRALHAACSLNNVMMVELLISQDVDVNYKHLGATMLSVCAENGFMEIAKLLITNGADVNLLAPFLTPLMLAVNNNSFDFVKLLLASGADINAKILTGTFEGTQALHCAASSKICSIEIAEFLISNGADVNQPNMMGVTPLLTAIYNNNIPAANLFIDNGANVNTYIPSTIPANECSVLLWAVQKTADDALVARLIEKKVNVNVVVQNQTALSQAVVLGKTKMVQLLLDAGADVDLGPGREALLASATPEIKKLLQEAISLEIMTFSTLSNAKTEEELARAKKYILKHPNNSPAQAEFYNKALYQAAYNNNIGVVKLLLSEKADINFINMANTSLYACIQQGYDELAKLLVLNGADVNLPRATSLQTPLMIAAHNKNLDMVRFLLEHKAKIDLQELNANEALHFASCAKDCSLEIVELLIANGANINASRRSGATPLSCAIYNGNLAIAHRFIDLSADVNAASTNSSVLTCAVECGDDALVARLIEKNVNVNPVLQNETALSKAVKLGKTKMVQMLLYAGADTDLGLGREALLQSTTSDEIKKLLHEAIMRKYMTPAAFAVLSSPAELEAAQQFVVALPTSALTDPSLYNKSLAEAVSTNNIAVVKLLLAKDVNANYEVDGIPLIHLATKLGHIEIAKLLLNKGANIHTKSRNGNTAIAYAACYNRIEIAELMINADGLDVNTVDEHGQTPLYHAVCQNYTEIVKLLVDRKANPNHVTKLGETCLSYAVKQGNAAMVAMLIAAGADVNFVCNVKSRTKSLLELAGNSAVAKLIQDEMNKRKQVEIISYLQCAYASLAELPVLQLDSPQHLDLIVAISKQELAYKKLNLGKVTGKLDASVNQIRAGWLSRINSALCDVKTSIDKRSFSLIRSVTAMSLSKLLTKLKEGEGDTDLFSMLADVVTAMQAWGEKYDTEAEFYVTTMLPLNRIYSYVPAAASQPVYQGFYQSLPGQPASAAYSSAVPVPANSGYPPVMQHHAAAYQPQAGAYSSVYLAGSSALYAAPHPSGNPPATPPAYLTVSDSRDAVLASSAAALPPASSLNSGSVAASPYSTFASPAAAALPSQTHYTYRGINK